MMSKFSCLLVLFMALACRGICQKSKTSVDTVRYYGQNYHAPEFHADSGGIKKFISKNLLYPEEAREMGIEGRVIVRFMVEESGDISHAVVIKKIGGGCDEEALRIVRNMLPWQPATYKGKPIKSVEVLPITFKLL